jgi:hypothetical protein
LVDKNGEVSRAFVTSDEFGDLLSRNVNIYLALQNTSFPEDAVLIFQGIITNIAYKQGSILIKCSHPEELKRQDIYVRRDTELASAIDDTQTTIPLLSVNGIINSGDDLTSYVRIDDELIEVVDINTSTDELENAVRGALGTANVAHDDEAEVSTFYLLEGNSIDLALKLMLSGGPDFYAVLDVLSFVNIQDTLVANAIQFDSPNVAIDYGVSIGSLISITGAANVENFFRTHSC